MLSEDVLKFWGRNKLKRWSEIGIRDARIPDSSKQFLTQVGLPINEDWTLRFDGELETLPPLPHETSYLRIGYDDMIPICLDEKHGGRVIADESSIRGFQRFVNSSVEQFGKFLVFYKQYRTAARALSEPEILEVIASIEGQMRELDPAALADVKNYWVVIIEQMRHGLL